MNVRARVLGLFLAVLVAVTVPACALAIPVRLEAATLHKADAKGNQRLTPDTPEFGAGLAEGAGSILAYVATSLGGPWGDLAAAGAAMLLGAGSYKIGHGRGRKQAPRPTIHPSAA